MGTFYKFFIYKCDEHGEFRKFNSFNEAKSAKCEQCQKDCSLAPEKRVNRFGVAPMAIFDEMPAALQHPCDGKYYQSKSEFRKVTKSHGKVEVGSDFPTQGHIAKNKEQIQKEIDKDIEHDINLSAQDLDF